MPGGRPLKYSTPEEFTELAEEYFTETPIEEQCVTGLALHLDTSRVTLCNYQGRPEFFNAVKRAKDRIEHAYELRGMRRGNAFDIFALKNMEWKDTHTVDGSMEVKRTVGDMSDDELAAIAAGSSQGATGQEEG